MQLKNSLILPKGVYLFNPALGEGEIRRVKKKFKILGKNFNGRQKHLNFWKINQLWGIISGVSLGG